MRITLQLLDSAGQFTGGTTKLLCIYGNGQNTLMYLYTISFVKVTIIQLINLHSTNIQKNFAEEEILGSDYIYLMAYYYNLTRK